MNFLKKIINGNRKIQRLETAANDYKKTAQLLRRKEEAIMLDPKSHGLGKKGANPYESKR